MRILMISAEAPPLHRAGALVDVLDALPHELRERGHEVSVVLPFYREIRENSLTEANDTGVTVDIRVGEKNYVAEYFEGRRPSGVQLFFVRCDEFFDRPEIYGEHGAAFEDNGTRFLLQQGRHGIGASPDPAATDLTRTRLGRCSHPGLHPCAQSAIRHCPNDP